MEELARILSQNEEQLSNSRAAELYALNLRLSGFWTRWELPGKPLKLFWAQLGFVPVGQNLVCLGPCLHHVKVRPRRFSKLLEPGSEPEHYCIGRDHDVNCRAAEQAG